MTKGMLKHRNMISSTCQNRYKGDRLLAWQSISVREKLEKTGKGSKGIEIMSGAMIGVDVPSKKEKQTD